MRGYTHTKITRTNASFVATDIGASRMGVRNDSDGGWEFYAVFPSAQFTKADALNALNDGGIDVDGWPAYNAGQSFASPAYARVVGSRVLVTQRGGLDI